MVKGFEKRAKNRGKPTDLKIRTIEEVLVLLRAGLQIHFFTPIRRLKSGGRGHEIWLVKCLCGTEVKISTYHLARCLKLRCERYCPATTLSPEIKKHRAFGRYTSMMQRCYDPGSHAYKDYGGRGITVCDEWRGSPELYCAWFDLEAQRSNLKIDRKAHVDRVDNDGPYSPENCRITTITENARNKRNRVVFMFQGKECRWEDVEAIAKVSHLTFLGRMEKGWEPERAVLEPPKSNLGTSAKLKLKKGLPLY